MTATIKTVTPEIGKAYNVVRSHNAAGQPMLSIRRSDWRAVLITAENIERYSQGYYVQPIKDRHTPRLLAAGWTRFSGPQGECGQAIVTRGPLYGLACEKSAYWGKGGMPRLCAQHAVLAIEE